MAGIKPVIEPISPFDAKKGYSVYYSFTDSRQAVSNELVIEDISSTRIVYLYESETYEKVHHLPTIALENGLEYRAKIRVKFADNSYSEYSEYVRFRTLATPVMDITSIDGLGYVYNQDVTFIATYSQADGERIKSYRFSLFDENEDLIRQYPIRRVNSIKSGNQLSETISDLERGSGYFVHCLIETENGMIYSHQERFIAMYIVPSVDGLISTYNDEDNGFIRISSNLKQNLGTQIRTDSKNTNFIYEDGEWVNVPLNGNIHFTNLGMNKASDFIMKIWCKNVPDNTEFVKLATENDEGIGIKFIKLKDRIVAEKENGGIISRYASNRVTIPKDVPYMLYVKAIEHRLQLQIKIL